MRGCIAAAFVFVGCGGNDAGGPRAAPQYDTSPPAWAVGAELAFERVEVRSAVAVWGEAFDQSGEVRYRILVDGQEVGESHTTSRRLHGLRQGALHRVEVMAVDSSGNVSVDRLGADLRTPMGCEVRSVAVPQRIN